MNKHTIETTPFSTMSPDDVMVVADVLSGSDEALAEATYERISRGMSRTAFAALLRGYAIDQQTQLGNRAFLNGAIAEALATNNHSLVIMTDLVGFRSINNNHTHALGDTFMSLAANGFRATLRSDTKRPGDAFRYGGDEFVGILPNFGGNPEEVTRQKLKMALNDDELTTTMAKHGIPTFGIRAGFALVNPQTHTSVADVLSEADPKANTVCEYYVKVGPSGKPLIAPTL